jgi:DNA helicase-2/ATP-dependent DNA helicase PcrA
MEALYRKTDEGKERLENIRELVNFATRYDFEEPQTGIEKLLEEAALQSDQDELEDRQEAVSLMTVHASKGLEFDVVFVTGLEQGLFPAIRQNDSNRDEEEERRLFYVAITRARERLYLCFAHERMKYGSREYAIPSEFIDDIDARLIKEVARKRSLLDDEDIIR